MFLKMKLLTPILYGFMIALLASFLMLSLIALDLLGPDAVASGQEMIGGTVLFMMIYLFLLFGIYFVLKNHKESQGGKLTFKTALMQGLITSLSTAIFSVLFTYLFYDVLYPDYVTELIASLKEQMENTGIAKDKISEKLTERKAYYHTGTQSMYSFMGNLITGGAFTLLLSFFLKTKTK